MCTSNRSQVETGAPSFHRRWTPSERSVQEKPMAYAASRCNDLPIYQYRSVLPAGLHPWLFPVWLAALLARYMFFHAQFRVFTPERVPHGASNSESYFQSSMKSLFFELSAIDLARWSSGFHAKHEEPSAKFTTNYANRSSVCPSTELEKMWTLRIRGRVL